MGGIITNKVIQEDGLTSQTTLHNVFEDKEIKDLKLNIDDIGGEASINVSATTNVNEKWNFPELTTFEWNFQEFTLETIFTTKKSILDEEEDLDDPETKNFDEGKSKNVDI